LQAVYGQIQALSAELVVLSPELPKFSEEFATRHKLTFPILNDHGCQIAQAFGLAFTLPDGLKDLYLNSFKNDLAVRNGEPSWRLPMPARFVIDRAGICRAADVDPDYTVRPEPEQTVAGLKALPG
jgi:peroxiredoxin